MGFLLQGAHRGGTRFVERASESVFRRHDDHLVVADPRERRAEFLATRAQQRFPALNAVPLTATGRQALAFMEPDDPLVLASDTLGSLRETLAGRRRSQATFWQTVGRGPGGGAGMRLGLQGTLLPGDEAATRDSDRLLEALERLAPPASSRILTQTDALAATVLSPMRERVLSRTLRHLEETERDPEGLTGGPLSLVRNRDMLPLKPVRGENGMRFRLMKEQALETLDQVPEAWLQDRGTLGKYLMVALITGEEGIHLLTVAQSRRGRHRLEGLNTFAKPAEAVAPAMFTD